MSRAPRLQQLAVACALALATAATCAAAGPLQERVAAAREAAHAPALAAVLVSCHGEAEVAVAGVARSDGDAALDATARFNIGSNAKSMLASLAATYVQDGQLRWESRVGDVLGDAVPTIDAALADATLAQLLSHRSGLAGYDTGAALDAVRVEGDTPSAQRLAFARQVLAAPPAHPVGAGFVYSNAGYIVAGAMLEHLGGQPFETLMQQRLFAPLQMQPSFGSPVPAERRQPWGHVGTDDGQRPHEDPAPVIPPFLQPAGDVSLTPADYARYLREHLCGLRGEPTQLLVADTVRAMHAAQGDDGAGMGWGEYALGGTPSSVHVGGTGAFSAFVAVQPARDRAIATMTNSGADAARTAALSLLQALAADDSDTAPTDRAEDNNGTR